MSDGPNYLRRGLAKLSESDRRVLGVMAVGQVNKDPEQDDAFTCVLYALLCELVDLEQCDRGLADAVEAIWNR